MDQHLFAAREMLVNERDPALQMFVRDRLQVRSGQMEQLESCGAELFLVVAILLPKVDDCADAMLEPEPPRMLVREAAADSDTIGEPVEIRSPFGCAAAHGFFFIIFLSPAFFFIVCINRYCCFGLEYCCFCRHEGNNKASQLFRAGMLIHSQTEPIPA
jgi:hypothetical protein